MEKLLERILNIISNDAFPDEDKPYIIREVVATWNDSKGTTTEAYTDDVIYYDERQVEAQKEFAYEKGYKQAKEDIAELQQRELDERWNAGFFRGISDRRGEVELLNEVRLAGYKSGHIDGLEQGRAEADELLDQRERKGRKTAMQHAINLLTMEMENI